MKPIIIEMKARIHRSEGKYPFGLDVEGKAYPHVSSGSAFGAGYPCSSVAEAKRELRRYVEQQKEWFRSSYGRRVKVKLKVNNEVEQTTLF